MEGKYSEGGRGGWYFWGGVWKLMFPLPSSLTSHTWVNRSQSTKTNCRLVGLNDIHYVHKLNQPRRLTLNNRRFEWSKQNSNVRAGISRRYLTPFPRFTRYTHDRMRLGMNSSYLALCCDTVMNILPASHYTTYLYFALWQIWCMIFEIVKEKKVTADTLVLS